MKVAPHPIQDWVLNRLRGGDCDGYRPEFKVMPTPDVTWAIQGPNGNQIKPAPFIYRREIDHQLAIVVNLENVGGDEHGDCGWSDTAKAPIAVWLYFGSLGWQRALDTGIPVLRHEWQVADGKTQLKVTLRGGYCKGAAECWIVYVFDGLRFVISNSSIDAPTRRASRLEPW